MIGPNGLRVPAAFPRACALLIVLSALALPALVLAQQPGALAAPDVPLWAEGGINVVAREADGSLLVGGHFEKIKGVARKGLARILPDGSVDPDFDVNLLPVQGHISAIHVAADGSIFVGGNFDFIGGQSRNRLAKLSPATGAADPTWNPGANSGVTLLVPGSGDVLYVAGYFQSVGGQSRNYLAKLSTAGTGAADPGWNPLAGHVVNALQYDAANDRLYVGGGFTSMGGASRGRVARIDGSGTGAVDAWTADADNDVNALLLDGNVLYVGGRFGFIAGASRSGIASVSTDTVSGFLDETWAPNASSVDSMSLDGGRLYITGRFETVNGAAQRDFAALTVAGGALVADLALDLATSNTNELAGGRVFTFGDGSVHLAGHMTYVNGERRLGYVHFDSTGTLLPAVDALAAGYAETLLSLPDGGMLVGGHFHEAGDSVRGHVLKLDANGALDAQWGPVLNGTVRTMALSADGSSVYLGGDFTALAGAPAGRLVRVALPGSGVHDAAFAPAADAPVRALAVSADGAVYAGGDFTSIGAASRAALARLASADGAADPGFGSATQFDGNAFPNVRALALASGSLFVGGNFTSIGGVARTGLAKLDAGSGAVDAGWVADITGGAVIELLVDGAQLYVAGAFGSIGGVARTHIARLATTGTGSVDAAFAPVLNNQVEAVALIGTSVYLGGGTFTVDGSLRRGAARLAVADGALDPDWRPEFYDGHGVQALAASAAGDLYAGGYFRNVYTTPRLGLAALPATLAELTLVLGAAPAVLYEDSPVMLQITVGTDSGDPGALVLSGTSSNTGVLSNESLAAGFGGSGADRTLLLQAVDDRNGNTTITVTVSGGGASVQQSVDLLVEMVNDAPTLSIAGDRLHAAGTVGEQVVAGFASAQANDPVQGSNYVVHWLRDPQGVVDELQLQPDGTLVYSLSGASGGALFSVHVRDFGGTANGGDDTSETQLFRVLVGAGANMSTSIERIDVAPALAGAKGGSLLEFAVRVANNGPEDVPGGITLAVPVPRGATEMLWTCSVPVGGCTPGAGSNAVATSFGLAVGAEAVVAISLRSAANGSNFVDFSASTGLPDGMQEIDTGEGDVVLSVPATAAAVFKASFE